MIKNALVSLKPASAQIFKDKVNIILASIPVILGILMYYFLGSWIYGSVMDQGHMLIKEYVSEGTMGQFVYYIVAAILTIMLYFLVNWTFVIVVSAIASPFNDMLSNRIEKALKGQRPETLQQTIAGMMKNLAGTLINEAKKITFVMVLSVLALVLGFFPILTPLSVFLSILLLSIQFLDYSWSRHDLRFSSCVNDIRKHVIGYALGGAFFFIIVSIPVVNLIVPPLATSYFTILWMKNNERINQVAE
jgi:CysZ protein